MILHCPSLQQLPCHQQLSRVMILHCPSQQASQPSTVISSPCFRIARLLNTVILNHHATSSMPRPAVISNIQSASSLPSTETGRFVPSLFVPTVCSFAPNIQLIHIQIPVDSYTHITDWIKLNTKSELLICFNFMVCSVNCRYLSVHCPTSNFTNLFP